MNIAVILKQVPDTEARIVAHPAHPARIDETDIKFVLNPYDEFAVEEALKITEKSGGEVIGICIGPERSEAAIRSAMAMGIHRAVWIKDSAVLDVDVVTQGKIYAAMIKSLGVNLVFCGREMIDTQDDAVAGIVAQVLGWGHALNASIMTLSDTHVTVTREVEGAMMEFQLPFPAVVSCQKDLNEPRYPTLIAIKRAKMKEIKIVTAAELGWTSIQSKARIHALLTPPQRQAGKIITGEPAEVVDQTIKYLSDQVKLGE
jgi:electron transfer flavoprotein beta subunit